MITVLVTGAGGGVGLGIIKALRMIHDLDIKIVAADCHKLATGLFCADVACLIDRCDSDSYFESLGDLCLRHRVDFYFPGTDIELVFCAGNKDDLEKKFGVKTVISAPEVVEIANNKFQTIEFLKSLSLSHPTTQWFDFFHPSEQDFPIIVKPAVGCRSVGVELIKDREQFLELRTKFDDLLVQEYVDGPEFTCSLVKVGGCISDVIILQRDLRNGDTYRASPVKSDEIKHYVLEIAKHLDIEGGCNFQLRVDKKGTPKLFEINSRFSGSTPLCARLGFNPVEFYLKNKIGVPYRYDINYDYLILRYWEDVVIPKSAVEELSKTKQGIPAREEQFHLFKVPNDE